MAVASTPPSGGLLILLGPDRARKLERITAVAHSLAIELLDRNQVHAAQLSAAALGLLLREYPALSPLRLVVVDEAQRLDRTCISLLEDQAKTFTRTTCLILLVEGELPPNHPLTALTSQATCERFSWPEEAEVGRWAMQYAAGHGKRVDASAVRELWQGCGADREAIRTVLDQLISWVGSRPQMTREDVQVFLKTPPPPDSFALVHAIAERDAAGALRALQDQSAEGREPFEALGMLVWQLQRWLTVAHWLATGVPRERIETLTGLSNWQLDRVCGELAGRSVAWLQAALSACWELELGLKRGQVPLARVALEALVMRLCERARTSATRTAYSSRAAA